MLEPSCNQTLKDFCRIIVEVHGAEYLNRRPTDAEKQQYLHIMKFRGFPGCFDSWDCRHYLWKNCPQRLASQLKDKRGKRIIMEVICDHLYVWYFNWVEPGSLNDLNILNRSSIVSNILANTFSLKVNRWTINGVTRDWLYFLVDGMYPKSSTFIKSGDDEKMSKHQEHVRKEIERFYRVLVQKLEILKCPLLGWYLDGVWKIV